MNAEKHVALFAAFAETEDHSKPLVMTHLTFARLMDEIVLPYQTEEAFFIDGVPVTRKKLRRLKLIKQRDFFDRCFYEFHETVRSKYHDLKERQLYAEQYHIRLEALLREQGTEVTSQIVKAFDIKIRPSLKDYLPKREDLIKAALDVFVEAMKKLGANTP